MAARLLLVEDDPRIVSFLKRGLDAEGYQVDVARNGREALDMARAETFALILLDRMLPIIDGLTVCTKLRGRHAEPHPHADGKRSRRGQGRWTERRGRRL